MMKVLLIACGGAFGSVLRYLVSVLVHNWSASSTARVFGHAIPLGTLTVNLIGCFLIGVLAGLFSRNIMPHDQYRLALTVGVLGGFTTFSAFGLDTFTLFQRGHSWLAIVNVVANCVGGIVTVWIGIFIVQCAMPIKSP